MINEANEYEGPAIVEIAGHRKVAGMVRVVNLAGPMLRVDVPPVDDQPPTTQYWGASSIFAIHPINEALMLRLARTFRYEPASKWDLPGTLDDPQDSPRDPLPASSHTRRYRDDEDDEDEDREDTEGLGF